MRRLYIDPIYFRIPRAFLLRILSTAGSPSSFRPGWPVRGAIWGLTYFLSGVLILSFKYEGCHRLFTIIHCLYIDPITFQEFPGLFMPRILSTQDPFPVFVRVTSPGGLSGLGQGYLSQLTYQVSNPCI